jgi:hypothetical protein
MSSDVFDELNIQEHLITKKIPAVTIVAAWINAETGVGPSIASGSQLWRPNWADFPVTATIKNKEIKKHPSWLLEK